jgi:hypothetical protein
MDARSQVEELLKEVGPSLPPEVVKMCEALNRQGKWDLALDHCRYHLKSSGVVVSERASVLLASCTTSQGSKRSAETEKKNRIAAALSVAIASIGIFLVSEFLSFSAVFGFCINVPGIDHCGGHNAVGLIGLIAFSLGVIVSWLLIARMKKRSKISVVETKSVKDAYKR